ncbi:MAG: HAD hydrolase family protein [Candidatus Hydrogenedentes bacterium]|nr:HAD hydrolase family protein [Candidatus Hydrogenedentota bacterium]
MIKLIISDVDGCISPEASLAWDRVLFDQLAQYSRAASADDKASVPLTLCTGRPQPYVEVLMKLLDIRYPAICEAGAVYYTLQDNRSVFAASVSPLMVEGLQKLRHYICSELLPRYTGLVYQFGKEAQLSLFCEDPSCFPELTKEIIDVAETIPGLQIEITPTHFYLNIDLKGVTKGAAIEGLAAEFGFQKENLAGIGDTCGDLSIRDCVSFFACPSNAVPEIKAVANYISPYPDIQGVLDILKHPTLQGQ